MAKHGKAWDWMDGGGEEEKEEVVVVDQVKAAFFWFCERSKFKVGSD
jgi:hypothetical protein